MTPHRTPILLHMTQLHRPRHPLHHRGVHTEGMDIGGREAREAPWIHSISCLHRPQPPPFNHPLHRPPLPDPSLPPAMHNYLTILIWGHVLLTASRYLTILIWSMEQEKLISVQWGQRDILGLVLDSGATRHFHCKREDGILNGAYLQRWTTVIGELEKAPEEAMNIDAQFCEEETRVYRGRVSDPRSPSY